MDCEIFSEGKSVLKKFFETEMQGESDLEIKKHKKRFIKNSIYALLKEFTGKTVPWGSLTGIRPTKLAREIKNKQGESYAKNFFKEVYDVSDKKIKVAFDIVSRQEEIINSATENSIDIYVGIPFCKTRCSYCSFVSREYDRNISLKDDYIKRLKKEIAACKSIAQGRDVRCVYIGGGTPTALSEYELEEVLQAVNDAFPNRKEFTVEAGRPDTITKEKLYVIKQAGANRISVNAQTTNDETLKLIGRNYPASEFFTAFEAAQKMDFDSINTDIILGLPGENKSVMQKTISDVLSLQPQNVTVHTLAIKNSSYLAEKSDVLYPSPKDVSYMVEYAADEISAQGYDAYYMYRQKYMAGNLENVGYAKKGKICVYNIDIMEETVSILALGAGGISKRVFPKENRIERACNVKDIINYTARPDEMIQRKLSLFD